MDDIRIKKLREKRTSEEEYEKSLLGTVLILEVVARPGPQPVNMCLHDHEQIT